MFEKNMKFSVLLDFYGEIFDQHTRKILEAYYEDDLSLAEIAEDEGISRQGVRHIIKKGEEQLEFFENKLMLSKHNEDLKIAVNSLLLIKEILSVKDSALFAKEINTLDEVIGIISNKGV